MFDWDEHNIEHIARHAVETWEAEEALLDPRRIRTGAYNTPFEKRYAVVGATEGGRIVFVAYTQRRDRIRVVTARDADTIEKRKYRRK